MHFTFRASVAVFLAFSDKAYNCFCFSLTFNQLHSKQSQVIHNGKSYITKTSTHLFSTADKGSDENHMNIKPTGVTLKMAFDNSPVWGVADNAEEKSERFTSPSSLDLVHRLRRVSDCVVVGRGTVERDNCTLTVRRVKLLVGQTQPVRVVIDPTLRLLENQSKDNNDKKDPDYKFQMLQDGLSAIIYHSSNNKQIACGKEGKVELVNLNKSDESNQISPQSILSDLASKSIHHIMVEGGPATALSFLNEKVVDRAIIIKAPIEFKEPVLSKMTEQTFLDAGLVKLYSFDSDGDIVEYWSRNGLPWPNDDNLAVWP